MVYSEGSMEGNKSGDILVSTIKLYYLG